MKNGLYARLLAGLLLFVTVFLFLVDTIRFLFAPLFIGIILAIILIPLDNYFIKKRIKHSAFFSILLVYVLVFVSIYFFAVPLINSTKYYIISLPSYIIGMQNRFGLTNFLKALGILEKTENMINSYALELLKIENVFGILNKLFKGVYLFFLTPVFAFYFLKDRKIFKSQLTYFLPEKHKQSVSRLYNDIIFGINTYVYGYAFIAILCGVLSLVGYYIVGINQWLFLGFSMMCCSLIPFIGPFIGGIPALIVSANLGWRFFYVLILIIVIQQISANILTPKTVENSVGIHPVFVIGVMFIGFGLFGIKGLMFSVPVFIILKVIIRYIFENLANNRL